MSSLRGILTLGLLMALSAGVLAVLERTTRDRIEENLALQKDRAIRQLTGLDGPFPQTDFVACPNRIGVVRIGTRGYGGSMQLIAAFAADGTLRGVRVPEHHETPGYADILDPDDWMSAFATEPLAEIDAVTGATVTSSAVLRGVAAARARLTALPAGCKP